MQAQQSSKSLTIAAPRDFTAKWLAPRLAAYGRTDPELRFALVAADESLDFTEANLDLAIRYGKGGGEHESICLSEGAMVMVEAPEGGGDTMIAWPGCEGMEGMASLRVADAGLAIEAAANGFGRACVPHLLAEADIAAGRVRATDNAKPSENAYWLVAPLPQWRQKKVRAIVEALSG